MRQGRRDKAHVGEGPRAMEVAGLDVSISLAGGQEDFVLGLKDGNSALTGLWRDAGRTGTIVVRVFCSF